MLTDKKSYMDKRIKIVYVRHLSNNLVYHQREKLWCVLEKK